VDTAQVAPGETVTLYACETSEQQFQPSSLGYNRERPSSAPAIDRPSCDEIRERLKTMGRVWPPSTQFRAFQRHAHDCVDLTIWQQTTSRRSVDPPSNPSDTDIRATPPDPTSVHAEPLKSGQFPDFGPNGETRLEACTSTRGYEQIDRGEVMFRKRFLRSRGLRLVSAAALAIALAVLGSKVFAAQDKYTLRVPGGLAFADFRGYENWEVVSVSQTEELLKVMVANPTMINAYRAGVPGNGKPFPDDSKIAKIEWKPKKNTEAPFFVRVPDTLQDVFLIEKNSKKFPATKGWAYAAFDYDPASDTFKPDPTGVVNCGFACHTGVAAKDYIFTAYGKR
jgi:hypothetical protein